MFNWNAFFGVILSVVWLLFFISAIYTVVRHTWLPWRIFAAIVAVLLAAAAAGLVAA